MVYIRLFILILCLFIEIVLFVVLFKGIFLVDDMCKIVFFFIIIFFIFILIIVYFFGFVVFEFEIDDLEMVKLIVIWIKFMGFVLGFFMFWYFIYLFD